VDVKFLKGAFMLPEEEVAVLETVSVEDVLAVMRKIFSGNRRTVTIKGPEANKRLENSLNRKGDFMEPFF
jgi:predicted Zn-dependent peptidase